MIKAGVIGWPISHSLSPKLHGYWLDKYNIDGEYKAYPVEPEKLEAFIRALPENGFAGCNVTIPHKEKVFELLKKIGEVDDIAAVIGAVNTIEVKNNKLRGTNTDAYGFSENIHSHLAGKKKAVVLGAGGAAYAVCYALLQLGFEEIVVRNRTFSKVKILQERLGERIFIDPWADSFSGAIKDAELLVNATSIGMTGQPLQDINITSLPVQALVTDIVYNPLMTPLLEAAKARGNPIVDGLGMLLHQAVPGFEAWFGERPEVTDELRRYIERQL